MITSYKTPQWVFFFSIRGGYERVSQAGSIYIVVVAGLLTCMTVLKFTAIKSILSQFSCFVLLDRQLNMMAPMIRRPLVLSCKNVIKIVHSFLVKVIKIFRTRSNKKPRGQPVNRTTASVVVLTVEVIGGGLREEAVKIRAFVCDNPSPAASCIYPPIVTPHISAAQL